MGLWKRLWESRVVAVRDRRGEIITGWPYTPPLRRFARWLYSAAWAKPEVRLAFLLTIGLFLLGLWLAR
jgi:hypothetical protein